MIYDYSEVQSLQNKNFNYDDKFLKSKSDFYIEKICRIKTKNFPVKATKQAVEFLNKNPELKLPLIYVESVVADYFKNSSLILEYVGEDGLLMSIVLKETPENALKKLWQFDDEWWLNHENLMKEKLCIDVVTV